MFDSKKNIEILKQAFDEYSKRYVAALPTDEELTDLTLSDKFERKMQRLIKAEKRKLYYLYNTVAKRVACIVLAIIISFTTVTFSVDALREPFVKFVVEVYEKFTSLFFEKDTEIQSSEEEFVFVPIEPSYIPDGYVLEHKEQTFSNLLCIYSDGNGNKIHYRQRAYLNITMNIDTETTHHENILINNNEAVYYEKYNTSNIIFNNGEYIFVISSQLTKEEIIKIAESIKN